MKQRSEFKTTIFNLGESMFIRLGNRYLNSRYIVEIKPLQSAPNRDNVTATLQDGSSCSGYLPDHVLDALTEHVVPAPTGYEAYHELEGEDVPEALAWKPVVAFTFGSESSLLAPVTAENVRMKRFAVRSPNGHVYTSYEMVFDSIGEYRNYLVRELTRIKARVA